MHKKAKVLLCSMGTSFMLGGCSGMINSNNYQKNEQTKDTQAAPSDDSLIRKVYDEDSFNPENIKINIQLFMGDKQAKPSEEIFIMLRQSWKR
ncbi:MAG: hypothetical protein ACQEXE_11135 [Bacillota bacterium]